MRADAKADVADLERQFAGFRFRVIDEQDRVRAHIKIFVNREQESRLERPLAAGDQVLVVAALSGG